MVLWVFQLLSAGQIWFPPGSPFNLTVSIFPSLILSLCPELGGQSTN